MTRGGGPGAGLLAVAGAPAALPLTGFPFIQAGIVALVLIVGGGAIAWAGGQRPR
jgi:hypothetical protein